MDWDDIKPKPAKVITIGEDLATLSIGELEARIVALEGEVQRIRTEVATKQARAAAAADLFKR